MELELVSIKDSSQGCRGMGSRSGGIASLFKQDMITIEQWSLRAEGKLAGHCDHEQEESSWVPQRRIATLSGEMNLGSDFSIERSQMGFEVMHDSLRFKTELLLVFLVFPPCCFSSWLRARRRCSSMKTGSLQSCNLMAYTANKKRTFYWLQQSLVYYKAS